jgi:DNA polymerase-4
MLQFPLINDTSRKIIHIDMDAFFASVEIRDNPALVGKPVVIARHPKETGGKGVVSTASYEARKYGIHSAMSAQEAYELCPQAVFISGNYEKYRSISKQIHEIFHRYTDLVEGVALDEAYLDVTENKKNMTSAIKIAQEIQLAIYHETGLTCSAGVSYNKFLAKIASDYNKPSGLTVILPEKAQDFIDNMSVKKIPGVGAKTFERLQEHGLTTGKDVREASPLDLVDWFGKSGWNLYLKANGIHNSPVVADREPKSYGVERTFGTLLHDEADLQVRLSKYAHKIADKLKARGKLATVLTLKIRSAEFETITKRQTLQQPTDDATEMLREAEALLTSVLPIESGVRLLGLSASLKDAHQDETGKEEG